MALSLLLRNTMKLNGVGLLKSARIVPLKSFATLVAKPKPVVSLVKNVMPVARTFTLTAPKMVGFSNHTMLWKAERIVSAALLGIMPIAIMFPSQTLDALMAISIIIHTHWGVEAIITDYMRPNVVGPMVPKVSHMALILVSIASLGGLFYLIFNDIGISKTIRQFWEISGYDGEVD
ncbi:succinate dehydrogenase [ubiquinone] cytochrome b small subunit, mitochondrial [Teleopsis dalmanni]|uniref:succinate dehydrogenase [ubiquinone] cytochrome b small subunit, mitochondrial n=1 Tax=Teleopsis dalmanni TaxID=139649 RepID=UPI0018CCFE1B|nr:succinate dehydrogenase [ubiquinone] cytochrome b small subunit, mitochondrial [Teleopsis dalmanni]